MSRKLSAAPDWDRNWCAGRKPKRSTAAPSAHGFQARGFYERLGYRVAGTIDNQPPGHGRHFLHKPLGKVTTMPAPTA